MKENELVGVEAIQDMIELCLYSNNVKDERIVSAIIIAEPEGGKTEMMKKYRNNKGVYPRRTATAFSIINDLKKNKIKIRKSDKQIGHLVIYDLTDIFAYAPKTVNQAIQFLCALIEEGLSQQGAYWIESEDTKRLEGVKGGLVAGVNTFGFFTKSGKVKANLFKGGLLSRLIPFSISYSMTHIGKIFDSIRKQRYHVGKGFVDLIDLNIPQEPVEVRISKTHLKILEDLAKDVSRELSYQLDEKGQYKSPGFRLYKSFISLAKASALRNGRTIVSSNDIGRIKYLSHWMNLKMNALNQEYPDNFRRFI